MPSTYLSLHYHLVFSTKNREPLIDSGERHARESVGRYIQNQEQHHKTMTFRDEVIQMLEKVGVEYDPRFLD